MLENVEITEHERLKYNLETKKRLKNVGQEHIFDRMN